VARLLAETRTERERMDANQAKTGANQTNTGVNLNEMWKEMRDGQQHLKEEMRACQVLLKNKCWSS
jgi:hypothetical protein